MSFKDAIAGVLKREGYLSEHPSDRGGVTKFGITMATLAIYRKGPVSEQMVKDLTLEEALQIYDYLYWKPLALEHVKDSNLSAIILDQAVNRGAVGVVKRIQRLLGVPIDGVMGMQTLAALNAISPRAFALRFLFDAQQYYVEICVKDPTQLVFLRGWIARTQELLTVAIS